MTGYHHHHHHDHWGTMTSTSGENEAGLIYHCSVGVNPIVVVQRETNMIQIDDSIVSDFVRSHFVGWPPSFSSVGLSGREGHVVSHPTITAWRPEDATKKRDLPTDTEDHDKDKHAMNMLRRPSLPFTA